MDMVQFHPTGMVHPPSARGLLVTEAVRGEGGRLYNGEGERFMLNYDQRGELATRDVVTRAIFKEIQEGRGSEHGGVYLDVSHLPSSSIEEKLGTMLKQFLDVGVDMREEPVEVSPTAHHFMGGIKIDSRARSSIPNLFSCGEVSGGVHGANRLGGNSLAETQVFGAIAGEEAAREALNSGRGKVDEGAVEEEVDRILGFFREESYENSPYRLKQELQSLMWEKVGISRTKSKLEEAFKGIERIEESSLSMGVSGSRNYNLELLNALELEGMLNLARVVTRCALLREESRGAHYREDFPQEDPRFLKNTVISKVNGEIEITAVEPKITRFE